MAERTSGPDLGLFWACGRPMDHPRGRPVLRSGHSGSSGDVGAGAAPFRARELSRVRRRPVPLSAAGWQVGVVGLEQLAGGQFRFCERIVWRLGLRKPRSGAQPGAGSAACCLARAILGPIGR